MKKIIIGMLLTVAIGLGAAIAQTSQSMSKKTDTSMTNSKSGWVEICETKVNLKAGHEVLMVNNPDRFTAIRVEAKDQPIKITNLELFYKSGATQTISLNTLIKPRSESKAIDLSGKTSIAKIDLQYKAPEGMTSMKQDNATVVVMGLTASLETQTKY